MSNTELPVRKCWVWQGKGRSQRTSQSSWNISDTLACAQCAGFSALFICDLLLNWPTVELTLRDYPAHDNERGFKNAEQYVGAKTEQKASNFIFLHDVETQSFGRDYKLYNILSSAGSDLAIEVFQPQTATLVRSDNRGISTLDRILLNVHY